MTNTLQRITVVATLGVAVSLTTTSPAFGVGATTPFVTYEAEQGTLGGGATVRALAAPLTTWSDTPEAEASGRSFVQLQSTGDSLTLPNHTGGNVTFIDFRYSIPDAATGGGVTSTLNLYVDGVFRQSLYVTSKQTWMYASQAGNAWDGMSQAPDAGSPHIFFEEGHAFISGAAVAPGSTITFQKDSTNTASFYWIDCVDLENPPPPLTQPAGSISITDSGAVATTLTDPIPNDAMDSTTAIQNTINEASAQGKTVWIPAGRFILTGGLTATGVTIEGAGMWYSAVYLNMPLPVTTDLAPMWNVSSVTMRNFLVDSDSQSRVSTDGDTAGINISGTNWLVEGMWVQHTSSGVWGKGTGGIAQNNRMLSTWGDGININNGNHGGTGNTGNDLTVVNNYVRGVGDDGVTINSDVTSAQMQSPTLKNNTTVSIYWAHNLAVYGGNNDVVQDNLLCDAANFPAMNIGVFNGAPIESAIVQGNVIVRGGGSAYNESLAAVEIGSASAAVGNVQFLDNTIIDSMRKSLELTSATSLTFANNVIDGLWASGVSPSLGVGAIDIESGQTGSAIFTSNTLQDLLSGQVTFVNSSASGYQTSGTGNVGFDPTAPGPTTWMGSSDAGAARRTASCTTPVSLILGDAGSPGGGSDGGSGGASDGGGASPESGTEPFEDAGLGGTPEDASTRDGGPGAGASAAGAAPGCGCAVPGLASPGLASPGLASPGLASTRVWPGLLAVLASLGYLVRRRRSPKRARSRD